MNYFACFTTILYRNRILGFDILFLSSDLNRAIKYASFRLLSFFRYRLPTSNGIDFIHARSLHIQLPFLWSTLVHAKHTLSILTILRLSLTYTLAINYIEP